MFARLLAAPQALEASPRLGVEPVPQTARFHFDVPGGRQLPEEGAGREGTHLLSRRAPDRGVGRDEAHELAGATLCRESLEQRVRMGREPDLQGAQGPVLADAVEDHDSPRSLRGDKAGKRVGQLRGVAKVTGVQEVVAVEEVERRLGHRCPEARNSLLRGILTLPPSLVQEQRGGNAHVEGLDTVGERNRDRGVARPAYEWADAAPLGAENERDAA